MNYLSRLSRYRIGHKMILRYTNSRLPQCKSRMLPNFRLLGRNEANNGKRYYSTSQRSVIDLDSHSKYVIVNNVEEFGDSWYISQNDISYITFLFF